MVVTMRYRQGYTDVQGPCYPAVYDESSAVKNSVVTGAREAYTSSDTLMGLGACVCGCVCVCVSERVCMCVCRWEDINALPASSHSRAN